MSCDNCERVMIKTSCGNDYFFNDANCTNCVDLCHCRQADELAKDLAAERAKTAALERELAEEQKRSLICGYCGYIIHDGNNGPITADTVIAAREHDEKCLQNPLVTANAALTEQVRVLGDAIETHTHWLEQELGEWLPVESCHYPSSQLVQMKDELMDLQAALAATKGE